MTEEIEQLLRNLHLKKIAAIIDDELAHAEKHQLSYGAFLARTRPVPSSAGDGPGLADQAGAAPRDVDDRVVSLQTAARRQRQADPRARRPPDCRQSREPRLHWPNGRAGNGARVGAPAQGDSERVPRALHPCARSLR